MAKLDEEAERGQKSEIEDGNQLKGSMIKRECNMKNDKDSK